MKKVFFAFAASAVVFLSQSVLASSFTANPLWTAPAKGSLNRDTADLTGGGFNLFAYEFTVTSNITVDALGTYVGVNDDGKSKASAKGISPLEPDSTDDWTNPGNPETVALFETTWNTAGTKVTGWTEIASVSIDSTDLDVYDDIAWASIADTTLDPTVLCGKKDKDSCAETYAVELDTNGDFIYNSTTAGPQSVADGVNIVLNGNDSSSGSGLSLASYRKNDNTSVAGFDPPGPIEAPDKLGAATDYDYYGPFVGETPEPGSLVLLGTGFGLIGLLVFLRHRRAASHHTIV
jgi:hypothetical protein